MSVAPAVRRSATRPAGLAAAAARALGQLGLAALVVFHVGLLGQHLFDGRALEPATAARWGLAALVLAGFRALSRRGLPLFVGRRAVGLWLLVVILHCSAAWEGGAAASLGTAVPESVTALAQLSAVVLVLGTVLTAAFAAATRRWARRRPACSAPVLIAGLPSTGVVFRFSPRPPPLA
jgi:hypothetical protein